MEHNYVIGTQIVSVSECREAYVYMQIMLDYISHAFLPDER